MSHCVLASTQYVFEIPEPSADSTDFGQTSSVASSMTESFIGSSSGPASLHTLALAHGLKLFSGAMLAFTIASVALQFYGTFLLFFRCW